jgi:ribosomal protein S6--L-glutamate ligase
MRILVLSRNSSLYSTSRLVLAARARKHTVVVADPLDFQLVVGHPKPALLYRGVAVPQLDLVIPRIGSSITHYGTAIVRQFDLLSVPVLNNAEAITLCRDKLKALQVLNHHQIGIPATVCARNPTVIETTLEQVGGTPVIVKVLHGTQGIGTMIAETSQAAASLMETLWAMGQEIFVQEYVRSNKASDIRAIVVGNKVIAAMRRTAKQGEFRANLHRGGVGVSVKLTKAYQQTAIAATQALNLHVAGVDMVEGKAGPQVLEVNCSPGLEGIERVSEIDVAQAIVAYSEKFVQQFQILNKHTMPKKRRPRAMAKATG